MSGSQGFDAVVSAIRDGRRFLITSHVAQDGDNISAQLALALILDQLGKEVVLVDADPVPERFRFLPGTARIGQAAAVTYPADYALIVDTTRLSRTGLDWTAVRPGTRLVNIDHHASNEQFGDINWVEPGSPATCSLVHRLARRLEVKITPEMATCLFTGIMTDTGYFHFDGTTQDTFRVAAELVGCGAPHVDLYRRVYDERPVEEMRLMGHALADLQTMLGERVAWIELTRETFERARADYEHVGSVANSLTSIRGVDVGLTFEERGDARTLVEIRSRGAVDVGTIARELGGGGHRNASGCTLEVGMAQARAMVLSRIAEAVQAAN